MWLRAEVRTLADVTRYRATVTPDPAYEQPDRTRGKTLLTGVADRPRRSSTSPRRCTYAPPVTTSWCSGVRPWPPASRDHAMPSHPDCPVTDLLHSNDHYAPAVDEYLARAVHRHVPGVA